MSVPNPGLCVLCRRVPVRDNLRQGIINEQGGNNVQNSNFWKLESETVRLASEHTLIPYLYSTPEVGKPWVEVGCPVLMDRLRYECKIRRWQQCHS